MIVNQLNQGLAGRGHTIQEIQVARRINSGERSAIFAAMSSMRMGLMTVPQEVNNVISATSLITSQNAASRARIGEELEVRARRVDLSIAISHINKRSRRTGRTDGDILNEERRCLTVKNNLILKRKARKVNCML